MKLNLILIGIILLLLIGIYFLWGMYLKERTERKTAQQTNVELVKDTTEKASIISITKKQSVVFLAKYEGALKEINVLRKDVKELHSIKYKIGSVKVAKTDTFWNEDKGIYLTVPSHLDSIDKGIFYHVERPDYKLTWYFDHGCFQNIVTFDPSINQATDSLTGEIQINRIVSIVRPKLWFWKLKWRKSKWATQTKVISNCPELKIKENTVIEVR